MFNHRVAYAYAKSLMELAIERVQLEEVHEDFLYLAQMSKSNKDLSLVLKNPIISADKKLKVLNALYEKRGANKATLAFFEIICRKNRASDLPEIASEFHHQWQVYHSIQEADVTTTFPLDERLRDQFKKIVLEISGMKEVVLNEKVDPQLIGGFVLKVNDRQLDASISSKLKMLRTQFSLNHYESKI